MVLILFTWGLIERRYQVPELQVGSQVAKTNYIQSSGGESARISIFVIKMVQEIESVQLVIFYTADNRLNSPKSGNYFSNDSFSFLWVIWECLMKQKYFSITSSPVQP